MAEQTIDFTTADEAVNTGGVLTILAALLSVLNGPRNTMWFAYFNIASFISGTDFIMKFNKAIKSGISQTNSNAIMAVLDAHTAGNDWRADIGAGAKSYSFSTTDAGASTGLFFDEFDGVSLLNRDTLNLSGDTNHYYEWDKTGSTAILDAWTDSSKGTHISGFPLSISLDNDIEMPHFMPLSSSNIGTTPVVSGSVGPLTIDFGGGEEDLLVNHIDMNMGINMGM